MTSFFTFLTQETIRTEKCFRREQPRTPWHGITANWLAYSSRRKADFANAQNRLALL